MPLLHGDADVCPGQRGRIVDAVTGHGHAAAVATQLRNEIGLLLRQEFGMHLGEAERSPDGVGRTAGVAGEHDDANAGRLQGLHCLRGGFLDGIGEREDAHCTSVHRQSHDGRAVRRVRTLESRLCSPFSKN